MTRNELVSAEARNKKQNLFRQFLIATSKRLKPLFTPSHPFICPPCCAVHETGLKLILFILRQLLVIVWMISWKWILFPMFGAIFPALAIPIRFVEEMDLFSHCLMLVTYFLLF